MHLAIVITVVAVSLSLWSIYEFYLEEQRLYDFDSRVRISYTITVASNSSDQFRVLCPLPVDSEGVVWPLTLGYLHVTGNSTTALIATEYGEALEVVGNGIELITMNILTEPTGPYENLTHYQYLSMAEFSTELGYHANLYSDTGDVQFGLAFRYAYIYANCGAVFVSKECLCSFSTGWNTVSVDSGGGTS